MTISVSETRKSEHDQTTATTYPEKVDLRKCKLCHKGVLLFIIIIFLNSACVQVVSPGGLQLRPYIRSLYRFFKCESPSKPLCLSHHQWHKCVPLVGLARRTRGMGPWSEGNHTDKERRPEGRHRRAFEWDFLCLRVVIVSDVLISASASRVENWGDWCGVRYVHARDFETGKINRRW